MSLHLTSPAFEDRDALPQRFTRSGMNCSPPLSWRGVPSACAELALMCEDLDAAPGASVHWILYGIPPTMTELAEAVGTKAELPWGGRQGENSFATTGYTGPNPRSGTTHRYQFTLFALDVQPALPAGLSKRGFLRALNGKVLARTHLTATCFSRRKMKGGARRSVERAESSLVSEGGSYLDLRGEDLGFRVASADMRFDHVIGEENPHR